jgi:hypothetical protein
MHRVLALALLLFIGCCGPAVAFGTQSATTKLELDDCTVASTNDLETVWACPGYKGIPVMVRKAQTRATLSFGLTSTSEAAANELLPPGWAPSPAIEWRLSNRAGDWTAFATIVHFIRPPEEGGGDVLVVTRLGAGTTCQTAFVDAKANSDAEALAEQAADAHGFDFDCGKGQPVKIGTFKAW